jgi:hypothetical protein
MASGVYASRRSEALQACLPPLSQALYAAVSTVSPDVDTELVPSHSDVAGCNVPSTRWISLDVMCGWYLYKLSELSARTC